jgi:MFS family permease
VLTRFCLYGFLKNQQYFGPFLILVFLEKGLSFFQIGLLVACRELTVNLLEVFSGVVADVYGRRRAMMTSFVAYIVSFLLLGLATHVGLLAAGMVLFGCGEAFRSGTHKAMIFTWLRSQNRTDERTKVYGKTRSWSKMGSAVAVVIGAGFVWWTGRYGWIFFLSVVPYLAGLVNFMGYPKSLDGNDGGSRERPGPRLLIQHLRSALRDAWQDLRLRRLFGESMGFEGVFKVAQDYLQPVLQAAAIPTMALLGLSFGLTQDTALMVAPVYVCLYLLSATASRQAHRLVTRRGGEEGAARALWWLFTLAFVALLPATWWDLHGVTIVIFIGLFILQNLFRPVLMSRFDTCCSDGEQATILSLEAQAKSLATLFLAPIVGLAVDLVQQSEWGGAFWPVAVVGCLAGLTFIVGARPKTCRE